MLPLPGETAIVDGWIVRNEGSGYGVRARRYDASPATHIVVVEWTHPNYGYWADAGVFVKFAHARDWEALSAVRWFEFEGKDSFLDQYPEFIPLFDERMQFGDLVSLPNASAEEDDDEYPNR